MSLLNNKKAIKLTDQQALDLYKSSNDEWKQILEDNYGKDFFKPKDITNEVNSILTLADYLDIEIDELFIFNRNTKDSHEKFINACNILPKVAEIYNEGTILNWKNTNEYRYCPYKYFSGGSGQVGLSYVWSSLLHCPGGFYYKSSKLSEASYNNFTKYWEDYWNVKS